MQVGVAFDFLILGHRKATLPAQRGAVVAPKQLRTWSGTISEGEGKREAGERLFSDSKSADANRKKDRYWTKADRNPHLREGTGFGPWQSRKALQPI
jgi:hypothetical protein